MNKKKLIKRTMKGRVIGLFTGFSVLMLVVITLTSAWMTYRDWAAHLEESQLSKELLLILRNIEHNFSDTLEATQRMAQNHYVINSLVDEQGRKAYLPDVIESYKNNNHVSSVNLINFFGKPLLTDQKLISYENFENDIWNVISLGEQVVRIFPDMDKMITMFPVNYYNTPQGAVIVEWDLPSIMGDVLYSEQTFIYKLSFGSKEYYSSDYDHQKNYITKKSTVADVPQISQNLGLEIEIGVDKSILFHPVMVLVLKLLGLGFGFVVFSVFLGRKLGDRIVSPITLLCQKVRDTDSFKHEKLGPVGTGDELEELAVAFEEKTSALLATHQQLQDSLHKLRQNNEQLLLMASVFQNALDGIVIIGGGGEILQTNPAFLAISGYTTEEVVGLNRDFAILFREDQDSMTEWQSIFHGKKRWQGEVWVRSKKGELVPCWCSASGISDSAHFVFALHDISNLKNSQELLFYQANHDALTGLANRKRLLERTEYAIDKASQNDKLMAVIRLDVKNLKDIIDNHGYHTGDLLLKEVAQRLDACCSRSSDTLAKLEGEGFAVFLKGISQRGEASVLARKILSCLQDDIIISGHVFTCSVDMGIAFYPEHASNAWSLLRKAGIALHTATIKKENNIAIFNRNLQDGAERRLQLEIELRAALSQGQLCLHYQPKICVDSGAIAGVEALMRWPLNNGDFISPAEFIPLAEEAGLMIPLGEYALKKACEEMKVLHAAGFPLNVAVNISPSHFINTEIIYGISSILHETGFPAEYMEVEITEEVTIKDREEVIKTVLALRSMNIKVFLDDFGTGYSSLSYLQNLPVEGLKIDISFIRELLDNKEKSALVSLIIKMAKIFNLKVVAEGVESTRQLEFLREHGCDQVQGYFFSRPVAADQLLQLLQEKKWPIVEGPFQRWPRLLGRVGAVNNVDSHNGNAGGPA